MSRATAGNGARATLVAWLCAASLAAQQMPLVEKPRAPIGLRSYLGTSVPPVNLGNSGRIRRLLHAGSLYLTVQDAIALAIENNLNLEIQRYNIPSAEWGVQRMQAGGTPRGVPGGATQVNPVDPGLGVLGSTSSGAVSTGSGGGGSVGGSGSGGASIQQIGSAVVNFDPSLTNTSTFSHATTPLVNLALSQTSALVDTDRIYTTQLQQSFSTGGTMQFRNYEYYQKENSPGDLVNPAMAPNMRLLFQQPLLQNRGQAFNLHSIRIAENGRAAAREGFRSELLNLVANVLNAYWDVVTADAELAARQRAADATQKFYQDTLKEIAAGALPRVEERRAAAEAASRRQDLLSARIALRQRESALKQLLLRRDEPDIDTASIVPLDHIVVPDRDDLPSLAKLVSGAMRDRPDVALAKIADENAAINTIGTATGLLPSLIAFGYLMNRGVAGTLQDTAGRAPASFAGGYGTALGQIARREFPTEAGGFSLSGMPIHNRVAQGDYAFEQLQLRQSQLTTQKDNNAIAVSVSNQMTALRQALARYNTAVNTRKLQEQLLAYEREKFTFGASTFSNLIIDQRALAAAEIVEVTALADYAHARVSLDQVLGITLENNGVTFEEGLNGQVARQSQLPDLIAPAKK
ncbi:MAG: TolC family protein [Bryobacteraceae bacterium]